MAIDPILTPKFRVRWTQLAEPDEKGKFYKVYYEEEE